MKVTELEQINSSILDWLRVEFAIDKASASLARPEKLDANAFAIAVGKSLLKSRKLSAAEIARLNREHVAIIAPAQRVAAQALGLERELSDLVNRAYLLTPDEVDLMWRTAPPRMPLQPASRHSLSSQHARRLTVGD
jgi:hypothetical protein